MLQATRTTTWLFSVGLLVAVFWLSSANAQQNPWDEPQDTTLAMNEPDRYAWQLFAVLNWPADPSTCAADPTKALGDPGQVVWELWRSKFETYLPNAVEPATWADGCATASSEAKELAPSAQLRAVVDESSQRSILRFLFEEPEGPFSTAADEEVRLNRTAYEFIRDNKLYSLDEQERLAAAGVSKLVFPLNAKEVKAHWVTIDDSDRDRYHWAETADPQGTTTTYGLVALHIITRDMPRWFWSTFEHVDNEQRWPVEYPRGFRGWVVPSRDSFSCPPGNLACNQAPQNLGLSGTKWENYRLRGTQIDWVDDRGNPTILANSKIEGNFDQNTMSCITCHALAVKGVTGQSMPLSIVTGTNNDDGRPHGYIGAPRPVLFQDGSGNEVPYLALDFMWSLRNAQREQP